MDEPPKASGNTEAPMPRDAVAIIELVLLQNASLIGIIDRLCQPPVGLISLPGDNRVPTTHETNPEVL